MKNYLSVCKKIIFIGLLFGLIGIANPTTVYAEEADEEIYEQAYEQLYEQADEEINEQAYEETDGPAYFTTTSNLRLRTGPSLDDDIISTIRTGSAVRVYDQRDGEWFTVSVNGAMGYMYAEFLAPYIPRSNYGQASVDRPAEPQVNIYGVELINWWDDARHNIIISGTPLHITDVRTGITYWVAAFSQGSHADVEPLTREDTDAMKQAFGGRWTWTPRPIWVTVDGRTFAASINGMPHAGSTNHNNGMNGHVCMHFPGSRTHNGTTSHERDHQNAIQEAFNASR